MMVVIMIIVIMICCLRFNGVELEGWQGYMKIQIYRIFYEITYNRQMTGKVRYTQMIISIQVQEYFQVILFVRLQTYIPL